MVLGEKSFDRNEANTVLFPKRNPFWLLEMDSSGCHAVCIESTSGQARFISDVKRKH